MKKFIFEEKFISYADVEIYAENEEDARRQFQNGNYQYYDVSDFTDGHELINVREVTECLMMSGWKCVQINLNF